MCAVCFTAYDLIPAGAVWMRARWVKRSSDPDPADGGERLADPIGDQAVDAQIDGVLMPVGVADPRVGAQFSCVRGGHGASGQRRRVEAHRGRPAAGRRGDIGIGVLRIGQQRDLGEAVAIGQGRDPTL